MDRTHEPATEVQLRRLQQLGCDPGRALSREEAAGLLHELELRSHRSEEGAPASTQKRSRAVQLRLSLEDAKLLLIAALPSEEPVLLAQFERLRAERMEFWINTCREPELMHDKCAETLELYRKHGCLYTVPNHEQVQEVLDALDAAIPAWDVEHPELYFTTLELNFPQLLKRNR
jgi:hypothetical protein